MDENRQPRIRFRLRTILVAVAILALLLVVVIQQVQMARMRQLIDARAIERDKLTSIIRELQDHIHRQK